MSNILNNISPKFLAETAPQSIGFTDMLPMIGWIVVMFALMYFLMIRPGRKKQKAEEKMRNELQIGDEIITISGVYCRIVALKDDSLVVESGPDRTKMRIARWAIQQNLTVHD